MKTTKSVLPGQEIIFQALQTSLKQKSDLLYQINTLKLSKHLKTAYPDLKNLNEIQLTNSYINQRLQDLSKLVNTLKTKEMTKREENDYEDCIDNLEGLLDENNLKESLKNEIASKKILVKELAVTLKENLRILTEMVEHNVTIEELEYRKQDLESTNNDLFGNLEAIKEKIIKVKEYLKSRKLRKRRFTVITLPPNRMQLRSKFLMKQELLKKIESVKLEKEEKKQATYEALYGKEPMTPKVNVNTAFLRKNFQKRSTMRYDPREAALHSELFESN